MDKARGKFKLNNNIIRRANNLLIKNNNKNFIEFLLKHGEYCYGTSYTSNYILLRAVLEVIGDIGFMVLQKMLELHKEEINKYRRKLYLQNLIPLKEKQND